MQEHPWVTENGANPLVSKDENIAYKIEPPTDAEVNAAITSNMKHLLVVVFNPISSLYSTSVITSSNYRTG